jgi:hypothetical protein
MEDNYGYPVAQERTTHFYNNLVNDIFSTLAPALDWESRNLITWSKPHRNVNKLAEIWNNVKPNESESIYGIDYNGIWQELLNDYTYATVWPIVNAMFFSEGIDNITRTKILKRNTANINNLNGSFFEEPLPVYDVIGSSLKELHPRNRSILAQRSDTPVRVLHALAKDKLTWSVLASNTGIDEVIMATLVESRDLYLYRTLIKNKNLTSEMVEFIWKEAEGKDASLIAELAFHPNTSYHLVKTLDSPDVDLKLADALLEAYAQKDTKKKFLSNIVFNIIKKAQKDDSGKSQSRWLAEARVNVLLRKLAFSNHINVNDWFNYLSSGYNTSPKTSSIVKSTVIRSLEFGNNLEKFCAMFKEQQNIDISGYSISMVQDMLGWEDLAEARW